MVTVALEVYIFLRNFKTFKQSKAKVSYILCTYYDTRACPFATLWKLTFLTGSDFFPAKILLHSKFRSCIVIPSFLNKDWVYCRW